MYAASKRAMDRQKNLGAFVVALIAAVIVLVVAGPAMGKQGGRGSAPRQGGPASKPASVSKPAGGARRSGGTGGQDGARRGGGRGQQQAGDRGGGRNRRPQGQGRAREDRERGHGDGSRRSSTGSGKEREDRGHRGGSKDRGDDAGRERGGRGRHGGGPLASAGSTQPTKSGRPTGGSGADAGPSSTSAGGTQTSGGGSGTGPADGASNPTGGGITAGPGALPTGVNPVPSTTTATLGSTPSGGGAQPLSPLPSGGLRTASPLGRLLAAGAQLPQQLAPPAGGARTAAATRQLDRKIKLPNSANRGGDTGTVRSIRQIVERVPVAVWVALGALSGLALALAPVALIATARSRRRGQLVEQLESAAAVDSLTGLLNRGALERSLAAELHRAQRYDRPLSLVYFDVNGLKAINDVHGHAAGDRLLKAVAGLFTETSRDHDLCGRIGGDECVVVLTEQDGAGAAAYGERVMERLPESQARLGLPTEWGLTAGIATFPEDGNTPEDLLAAADRRLYLQRGIRIEPRGQRSD